MNFFFFFKVKDAKGPPVKRDLLRRRDYKVDLDSKLGKSQVITKTTPASQSGGLVKHFSLRLFAYQNKI